MAALAAEPETGGVYAEALTEEGSEAFTVSDDVSVSDVFDNGFDEPAADFETADEASFYDEEAPGDRDADEQPDAADSADYDIVEDVSEEVLSPDESGVIGEDAGAVYGLTEEPLDALAEEAEEGLAEEALGEEAVPGILSEISEEEASESEPVCEEALGRKTDSEIYTAASSGTYGPCPSPVPLDNTAAVSLAKLIKFYQETGAPITGTPKSYKIVMTEAPEGQQGAVAKISGKGVITAQKPGVVLAVAYDSKKKPICCFVVYVSIWQKKNGVSNITTELASEDIFNYVEFVDYDGDIGDPGESYFPGELNKSFSYKSSNKKVLAVDENGNVTTGKSGSATITLTRKAGSDGEIGVIPSKLKLKYNVKLASVKTNVKITPGKTVTVMVKNTCEENKVTNAVMLTNGDHFEISRSGKYGEKIKIKASADGGSGVGVITLANGQWKPFVVYSFQTKKRVYTDAGASGTLGSYDTKTAKSLVKKINAARKAAGASKLTTLENYNALAAMSARGASTQYTRVEYNSKADILANIPVDALDPSYKSIGAVVFYDINAKKYYVVVFTI